MNDLGSAVQYSRRVGRESRRRRAFSVGRKNNAVDNLKSWLCEVMDFAPGGNVIDKEVVIYNNSFTVRRKRQGINATNLGDEMQRPTGGRVPNADPKVVASRSQEFAVWRVGETGWPRVAETHRAESSN